MSIAINAAGADDFGKLIAPHQLPVLAWMTPFPQRAAGRGRIGFGGVSMFAVVGVDQTALTGVEAFAVVAGKFGIDGGRVLFGTVLNRVAILDQAGYFECMDIHSVKSLLHGRKINTVCGVGQIPGVAGEPAGHELGQNRPHPSLRINEIGANHQLMGFGMNHPICGRAAHTFGPDNLLQIRGDFIKFIR